MALVLNWQKKLGYKRDPFDLRVPRPVKKHIVGTHDLQERINLFLIKEEQFGTITGKHGTGKTMLLRWIEEELASHRTHTQQFLDAKERQDLVPTLLSANRTILQRVFKRGAEQPHEELLRRLAKERRIILVDNAAGLTKEDLTLFEDILAKTPTVVIFADAELDLPFTDRLKVRMPEYGAAELTELLHRRIQAAGSTGTHPFDAQELDRLFKKTDRNPAKLLALARERAIELSLKVTRAPKAAAPGPGKGLFSIKIEKGPAEKNPESDYERTHPRDISVVADGRTDPELQAVKADPEKDLTHELDLLAQVVKGPEPVAKRRAPDKDLIKELEKELAPRKKKAKKKR